MTDYTLFSRAQLEDELSALETEYAAIKARSLSIDMTRGRPHSDQLDLADALLTKPESFVSHGVDMRNYGLLTGDVDLKKIFADIAEIKPEQVIIGGGSSTNLIFDTLVRAFTIGLANSERPWRDCGKIKLLCPCPGYDRHFTILDYFGIEMIPIKMLDDGPDIDEMERLAAADEAVKGAICVPVYSNPTGVTYCEKTVERLASMKTAAADFTLIWDNAYIIHHLYDKKESVPEIISLCERFGNAERPILFMSTSKITYGGSGVSCIAGSMKTVENIKKMMFVQTINYNKVNQLLHVNFLKNRENVEKHMADLAKLIAPKFKTVLGIFERELDGRGIARWSNPNGGYFISYYAMNGTAAEVVRLCAEAGVKLTPAGSAFPYGKDPDDSHIRVAPTMPSVEQLSQAVELMCVCARLSAVKKLILSH